VKAKPVTYKGINFRSTLEVKHYINMTEVFGWEVEYEPTIEGLRGWLPDFLIKGCQRDILVEVKPIRCLEEWENHPDYGKVINSGILNTNTLYDFLVLGANSFLIHSTPDTHDKDTVIGYYSDIGEKRYYRESDDDGFIEPLEVRLKKDPPTFIFEDAELTYCSKNERVGFSVIMGNWYDRINKENYHKPYNQFAYRREELEELKFKWNQIQSKYQWQPTR
jgi:hypothetical protein